MIRVAAVGDIHLAPGSEGSLRRAFETLGDHADLLLLAGDLTRHGTPQKPPSLPVRSPACPCP